MTASEIRDRIDALYDEIEANEDEIEIRNKLREIEELEIALAELGEHQ